MLIPLNKILACEPGTPLILLIWAPAIFPTSAWSTEAVPPCGNLSAVTDSTEMASFFLLVATPTPVTTTSESALASATRTTFNDACPL